MDNKYIPKSSKFERLEESLYDPTDEIIRTRSGALHPSQVTVEGDWSRVDGLEDDKRKEMEQALLENRDALSKKKNSFFKKFFISSLLFLFVAVGFGVYSFFIKNTINPEGNITIGVVGSTFTQAGEELPLTVEIENKNDFALEVVDLIVEYPREGAVPTANLETTERERISLGTIDARKHILKEVPLTLYGKEGDKKEIHFTLEYNIESSSTIFQKQKVYSVTLSSSPIATRIIGPEIAVPDQSYRFTVEVSTNTKKPLENILLALNYPVGFTYTSANVEPATGNYLWDIGTLVPGAPKTIEITGKFSGLEGDERSVRAIFGTYLPDDKTKISTNLGTLLQTVKLEKPFISTDLIINSNNGEFVNINSGEQVQGVINWKNNLTNQVLDLEIRVKLKGDLLDRSTIEAQDGFYDSLNDEIVWNKNTINSFVRVPAGAGGALNFTIQTIPVKTDGSMKNPRIEFEVNVKAIEDSEGKNPKTIESVENTTVRVGGDAFLHPSVYYHTGPITNTGAYPPKVNTETTYTVELNVTNTINDYTGGEVRTKLFPNVTFTGVVSPATEQVVYEEKTGELVWKVGNIPQSNGIARTVAIQFKVIPSLTQVGQFIPLLKEMTFVSTDQFTKTQKVQSISTITSEVSRVIEQDGGDAQVVK